MTPERQSIIIIHSDETVRNTFKTISSIEGVSPVFDDQKVNILLVNSIPQVEKLIKAEQKPNLVVMEVKYGNEDEGYSLLSSIKASPDSSEIPVVVISTMADRNMEQRCINLGASSFVDIAEGLGILEKAIEETLEKASK